MQTQSKIMQPVSFSRPQQKDIREYHGDCECEDLVRKERFKKRSTRAIAKGKPEGDFLYPSRTTVVQLPVKEKVGGSNPLLGVPEGGTGTRQ